MNYSIKRRLWAIVLVLALIVPMMPTFVIPANAAGTLNGLSVSDLGAEYTTPSTGSGSATWTVEPDGKSITGTAKGYKSMGIFNSAVTTTLTLKNNKAGEAILSFNYALTGGGSVSASSGTMADGTYSGTLASNASVVITLNSPKGTSTNTLKITDLSLLLNATGDVNTTFHAPVTGGSFKVDGAAISSDTVKTAPIGTVYSLVATAASGYKFVGWYQETGSSGKYFSTAATTTVEVDSDSTVYPVFISTATPVFQVGTGNYFYDLDDAVNYATANSQKQVTLISSGTISDANYTIPAGMTLYIPYSTDYTPKGNKPVSVADKTPTIKGYVTLTLGANTTITVDGTGTVEVGATFRYCSGGNIYGNAPVTYGAINMSEGSSIVVNSGATLYAWGYIYGNGSVIANSGSRVYEFMQIADFYGGGKLADMEHMFPFSQYYVQNIEVPLTIHYGATEYLYVKLVVSDYELPAEVPFIGTSSVTPMFKMEEGCSVTKDYDPTTDRLILDINGNAALQSVAMEPDLSAFDSLKQLAISAILNGMLGSTTINSANYILNLNSNMTININSGMTTISQEISALPGAEIYVDNGAFLKLASGDSSKTTVSGGSAGKNAYLFDSEQWGAYVFSSKKLIPAVYSPTANRYKRTDADLKDVVLDVNGTVITDGFLYTTVNYEYEFDEEGNLISLTINGGGASIISSEGTGEITMTNGAGQEMGVYNLDGAGASETTIFVASAQLKNGDGTYLDTTGAPAGTSYDYCATHDCWYTGECAKCNAGYKVTWIVNGEEVEIDESVTGIPEFDGTITVPDGKHFSGWDADDDGEVDISIDVPTANMTIVAIFEACYDNNKDHKCDRTDCGKTLSTCADNDNNHNCDVCNEPLSTCADNDNNHNCDVCNEPLSTCADNDNNHNCDVCDKPLSTCADNDNNHNCDVCNEPLSTCEDKDNDGDHNCDVCKKILSTCEDKDNDGDHKCDECGTDNVSDHTEGTPVKENIEEAKCEIAGKYDSVVYCTECGNELSRTNDLPIDALEHDWNEPTYTWSADGKSCTAERTCKRDGSHKETETVTATGVVTTDPTCTEMGTTTYTANFAADWAVDGQTATRQDVPAKDHAWTVSYEWSADGKSCTATRACRNDEEHNLTETVTATGVVTTDPTCTEKGTTTYTANFAADWAEQQTTTHDDVPAKEHAWTVSYSWSEDGKSCTATRVCGNDAKHNLTETVIATGVVTTPATCEGKGTTTYTANFAADWAEQQTATRDDVPAKDHAWTVSYSWSEDGKSCTATRACRNDEEHNQTETVTATGVVTTDPTCTAMGVTTYTANFTAEWAVDGQTTTRTDVAKEEHDFNTTASNQQATAADCENAATYYVQCDNCDAVSDTKTVAVGSANGHTGKYYFVYTFDETTLSVGFRIHLDCDNCEEEFVISGGSMPTVKVDPTCTVKGVYTYELDYSKIELQDIWKWENFELNDENLPEGAVWDEETKIMNYELTWETDPNNHSGKPNYTTNGDGTHSATHYECCNAPFVVTNEKHTYTNNVCTACGAKAFKVVAFTEYNATWNGNYVDIYKNDVRIASLTKGTTGSGEYNEIYIEEYDPTATYAVYWNRVDDGELNWRTTVTFNVGRSSRYYVADEMNAFVNGQLIYPKCEHGDSDKEYIDNENGTHNVFCNSCNLVVLKSQAHTYDETTHECPCGAVGHVCAENLTPVAGQDATCSATGIVAHYACSCGKLYSDAAATTEISVADTIAPIDADNHDWQISGYTNDDDKTHTINYVCGHNPEHTKSESDKSHDYNSGNSPYTCICGDVKQFHVYWYNSNSDDLLYEAWVDYGAPLPTCPNTPTIPEGFYGVGWSVRFTGEAAPETMPANDIHLVYSINPIKYTVTFLYENGETWQVLKALHGQVIKDLAENYPYPETKVGHTFIGWGVKNAETGEIELVTEMTATGELTLYPVFKVNSYTLEVYVSATGEYVDLTAEYGANLMDVLAEATEEGKIPDSGEYVRINERYYNGYNIPTDSEYLDQAADTWITIDELTVMPGKNIEIYQNCDFYGWRYNFNYDSETEVETYLGTQYYDKDDGLIVDSGWYYIEEDFDDVEGGAWYYFEEVSSDDGTRYFRAEGVTRADYPNDAINDITYGPDDRDLGKEDYPDTDSALFVFDEDGKFRSDLNGLTADNHWAVNGMLPWFVGLVEVDGDYYYFGANNIMVTPSHRTKGKIYLTRDSRTNVEEDDLFVENGIYFFGDDGKLIKNDGIAEMNGKLYYFIDYRLALGAGLVKENGNFYYVRSTGELVVNQSYWIYNVNEYTDIHVGIYTFDENGVMKVNSIKNGIYEEDGGLFYYENGKRAYKGLMEYEGSYIYVRSNGQLATGKYWITRTNDIKGFAKGTSYVFGADGKMLNGVVDGYYYENGKLAYKGLMEYEGSYIYVCSNGKLATGLYWINKTNKLAPIGKYDFGDDGKMIIDELPAYHNGVVDGYYYVDGVLQKGAGPIIWEENIYYVRSNGQVATGSYWTTVENEILSSGRHTFDKDGKLITE